MKKILFLLFLFTINIVLYAQDKIIPDKETTTIFLKVKGNAQINYKTFGRLIIDNEFIIEKSDPEFLTIFTQPKKLEKHPGWSPSWYFNVRFSDNKITIQPFWKANYEISLGSVKSLDTPFTWHYSKGKSNILNLIYEELIELVSKYPEAEISYN